MNKFLCLTGLLTLTSLCNARLCEEVKIIDKIIYVKMTDITETPYEFKYKFSEIKQTFMIQIKNDEVLEIKSYELPCIIGNFEDIQQVMNNLRIL